MIKILIRNFFLFGCLFNCNSILSAAETDTTFYSVFMGSREAGIHKSWINEKGAYCYYYTFNDRGRGPELTEEVQTDDFGRISKVIITGHDYTKNQVNEQFSISGGIGTWLSASDDGSAPYQNQYYYPINGTIGSKELLINQILKSEKHEIALLPFGSVTMPIRKDYAVQGRFLTIVGLSGISYDPSFYWIDGDGKLFAIVSPSRGITCIRKGSEHLKEKLVEYQVALEDEYYQSFAIDNAEIPDGPCAITNVAIFNARTGSIEENQTLIFEGQRIKSITASVNQNLKGITKTIDGTGKTLLPGFFDMHVHVDKVDGILHLAGGVTSVRDMAVQNNYISDKQKLAKDFEQNKMVGPRIVGLSGFIDGNGPFTRDKGIDNLEQGLQWIDEFHEAGLKQIKLYSSIKPEWVKPLAKRAHQYGMIVSGHIPAFMTATQAIHHGFDEIQHTNMLFLNFYGDSLDTRNMTRFSAVGEQAYKFDFEGEEFKNFAQLLIDNQITIDPTLAIFEWGFKSVSGQASPTYKDVVHRLPLTERREYYTGGFARPPGMHQRYLASYDRMVEMVGALYRYGVHIIPGTDNLPGFAYHRELELYVQSGIPAEKVLQLATIYSAERAGREEDLGSLEPGKLADMVLIDGDPVTNISAIRKTFLTIKDGILYDPVKLYKGVGVLAN